MIVLTIFGFLLLLASGLLLIQGVWALVISLDYRKGRTAGARAWLEHTKYTPKINSHDRQGRFIRCHTEARYAYTVDGKKYTLEQGFTNMTPGNLGSSAKVVYQKKRPDRAYLENISPPPEPFECFICFFLGLIFLAGGIALLS